jgi:hypothetical protein
MSDQSKERITEWLQGAPPVRGVLVRGIRFADETFVCDFDSRDFPLSALEQAWRSVADTFEVLAAQRLPSTRLTWKFERAVLHSVRRADGAILGAIVGKKVTGADPDGLARLLAEFEALEVGEA